MRTSSLIVGLIVACGASLVAAENEAYELTQKLDQFAKDPFGTSSGLTYEEYEAAYWDVKRNFPDSVIEEGRAKNGAFRMFMDFVIYPMDLWRLAPDEDDLVKKAFVNRIEQTYKRFWSAYVNGETTSSKRRINPMGFSKFYSALKKTTPVEPTSEMWQRAKKEYLAIKDKIDEIGRHEDIYADLEGLDLKLNFLNDWSFKYIMEEWAKHFDAAQDELKFKAAVSAYRRMTGVPQ